MNVTHDLIAAVSGPGWKYGLSRILINDEGEGVVFIAGSQSPLASFTVKNVSTSRGAGFNEDGDITWRRRGSSCQYKLAKCKVSTDTMTSWWEASLEPEPDDQDAPQFAAFLNRALENPEVAATYHAAQARESLEDLL